MLLSPNEAAAPAEPAPTESAPATPGDPSLLERQAARAVIVASAALFVVLLLLLPARFQGSDEAKYLGIGLNVLRGHGGGINGVCFTPDGKTLHAVGQILATWMERLTA